MADEVEEDIDSFMEVVTSYKCKFCDYITSTTSDMAAHVKLAHRKGKIESQKADLDVKTTAQDVPVLTEDTPSLETVTSVANDHQQVIQFEGSFDGGDEAYSVLDENVSQNAKVIPLSDLQSLGQGQMITITGDGQMLDDSEQDLPKSEHFTSFQFVSKDSQGQYSILQNTEDVQFNGDSTIQVLVDDSGEIINHYKLSNNEGDEIVDDCAQTELKIRQVTETETEIVKENTHFIIEAKDIEETNPVANKTVSTGTDPDQPGVSEYTEVNEWQQETDSTENAAGKADNDRKEDSDITTKELFLCGNCSEGFTSIQACKDHMIKDHGLTDGQGSGKVDMGTQMEPRKKVGRKRKSEKEKEESQSVEVEEDLVISDSDEDWSEQLHAHSSRSRRKRQPPKQLQTDYYLGRSKKKVRVESGLTVRCEVKGCTARFKEEETMKMHLKCHVEKPGKADPMFKCTSCTETFRSWKQARYHMWKAHRIDMDLLTCDICNNFKTDTMFKLKTHKEVHGTDRPYTCDICGKGFKQFAQMKNHQLVHTDEETKKSPFLADKWHTPKQCDICNRMFANIKCLKVHKENVHTDNKPFKCTFCSHSCSRKAMFILHMRTHTGDKPFKCDQCQYSCSDHNSLRRHKMRHTGQKPYKCPHCAYACIQAISLKVHVKNKHPGMGGVYNCKHCLYRTVNKTQYENHLNDHKNGLIEAVEASDGQPVPKIARPKRSKVTTTRPEMVFSSINLQQELLQGTSQPVQTVSLPSGQVIQIPISSVSGGEQGTQFEMQVQMNEAGESVVSAEDLAKLTSYDGLVQSDAAAVQLIYSALSAMSQDGQSGGEVVTQGVETESGDIQTSIQTDSKEGVTTHTITFHLPGEETGSEVCLQNL